MKNFFMTLSLAIIFGLGWFATDATQGIYAAKPLEYKVIRVGEPHAAGWAEKTLNTYAQQGWRLHSMMSPNDFIFER
jgi:uncharacterized protein DUF4177